MVQYPARPAQTAACSITPGDGKAVDSTGPGTIIPHGIDYAGIQPGALYRNSR